MPIGGPDNNDNIVIAPPPPPPPPPPPGGPVVVAVPLRPETEAEIARVTALVEALRPRIEAGDQAAIDEYKDERQKIYDRWFERNLVLIRNVDDNSKQVQKALQDRIEEANPQIARLQHLSAVYTGHVEALIAQREEIRTIPGMEGIVAQIEGEINYFTVERLPELEREATALADDITQQRKATDEFVRNTNEELRVNRIEVRQFKAVLDAIPALKLKKAAERVIDFEEWRKKGFFDGILFNNLRDFILKRDEEPEDYAGQDAKGKWILINQYRILANRYPELKDETTLMAIATGYMVRPDDVFATGKLLDPRSYVFDDSREALFNHYLQKLYAEFPNLRDTAPIHIQQGGFGAVVGALHHEHNLRVHADAARAAREGDGGLDPALNRMRGIDAAEARQAANVRRHQVEDAQRMQAHMQRAPDPNFNPQNAANALGRLNGAVGQLQGLTQGLVDNIEAIEAMLGIVVQDGASLEERVGAMHDQVGVLKDRADTPANILRQEFGRDPRGAFLHALDAYRAKHSGSDPNQTEVNKWGVDAGASVSRNAEWNKLKTTRPRHAG